MAETIGVYVFLVLTSSTNQKISFSRIIELVKHLLSDLASGTIADSSPKVTAYYIIKL